MSAIIKEHENTVEPNSRRPIASSLPSTSPLSFQPRPPPLAWTQKPKQLRAWQIIQSQNIKTPVSLSDPPS